MAAPPGAAAFEPAGGDEGVEDSQRLHAVEAGALPEVSVGHAASARQLNCGVAEAVVPAAHYSAALGAGQVRRQDVVGAGAIAPLLQ